MIKEIPACDSGTPTAQGPRMRSIARFPSVSSAIYSQKWAAIFSLVATFSHFGCRGREHVVSQAQAAPPSHEAELAVARSFGGDDDEEGGKPSLASGTGNKKWRDTGVYVDGKPVSVLRFGELPVALQPAWVQEKQSIEVEPGHKGPTYKLVPERRYRFSDYLRALGVDLNRVKQLHVMGPKLTEVIILSGADLRSRRAKEFYFRFGSSVGGKAIPMLPMGLGNGIKPDKVAAVMVYCDKVPPTLDPEEGLMLDGKPVVGVPYFGQPVRGGVRVYQDDRLKFQIKRPLLRETQPIEVVDGKPRYQLWKLLEAQGIDLGRVAEGWVIADERRTQRLSREELQALTFVSGDKEKSEIRLGPNGLKVNALALHAHQLASAELPHVRPDEEN
jgi:hypothetical protein